LTYSGWLTHISGHPSATGRAQDSESSPANDRRSTAVPIWLKGNSPHTATYSLCIIVQVTDARAT